MIIGGLRVLPIKVDPPRWMMNAAAGWMDPPLSDSPHREILDTKYQGNSTLSAQIHHATKLFYDASHIFIFPLKCYLAYHWPSTFRGAYQPSCPKYISSCPPNPFQDSHFSANFAQVWLFGQSQQQESKHHGFLIFSFLLRKLSLSLSFTVHRKSWVAQGGTRNAAAADLIQMPRNKCNLIQMPRNGTVINAILKRNECKRREIVSGPKRNEKIWKHGFHR